jgi:hypothetical protein
MQGPINGLVILSLNKRLRIASDQSVGVRFAVAGRGLALYQRCERRPVLPGDDVN